MTVGSILLAFPIVGCRTGGLNEVYSFFLFLDSSPWDGGGVFGLLSSDSSPDSEAEAEAGGSLCVVVNVLAVADGSVGDDTCKIVPFRGRWRGDVVVSLCVGPSVDTDVGVESVVDDVADVDGFPSGFEDEGCVTGSGENTGMGESNEESAILSLENICLVGVVFE